jgi:hypothetical protein
MFKKRGKAATTTLLIALIMILIFGFRASAQKNNNKPVSQAPEHKTLAAPGPHGSSGPSQYSLHPAARYATLAYEEIPDDFTEAVIGAPFPGVAQGELDQVDLSRYVRMSDNENAIGDEGLNSGDVASPAGNRANSPLLFYYKPSSPSSPGTPIVTPTPSALPTPVGPPGYGPPGSSAYVPANPSHITTGTPASATPVPSSLLLLGSGLIAFSVIKGVKRSTLKKYCQSIK